jgi:hypothetical protein
MGRRTWIAVGLALALIGLLAVDAAARGGGGGGGGRGGGFGGGGIGRGVGPGGLGGLGGRGGIGAALGRGFGVGGLGGGFGVARLRGNTGRDAKEWQLLQEQGDRKKMVQERRDALMDGDRKESQEGWLAARRLGAALGEVVGSAP